METSEKPILQRPGGVRLDRKEAVGMDVLVKAFLRANRLTARVNTEHIYAAWDRVSGMGRYTLRRYFRGGTLTITLSSAVVRSHLLPQCPLLTERINEELRQDPLFSTGDQFVGFVEKIVLK